MKKGRRPKPTPLALLPYRLLFEQVVGVRRSDLVHRLPRMMLGCLALYSLSVCSLGSGLAANHIPYIGARIASGESRGREGQDKAKSQCRNERFRFPS